MSWAGTLVGAVIGAILLKGLFGAMIGAVLGYQFDHFLNPRRRPAKFDRDEVKQTFFQATFLLMGHIAKADGRVSEQEVAAARAMMAELGLSPRKVREAIELFTRGRNAEFDLKHTLAGFKRSMGGQRVLISSFVSFQVRAAIAHGSMHPLTRSALWQVCQLLGVSRVELAHIEMVVRARMGGIGSRPQANPLENAYKVLGVKVGADMATVKRAYRKLMNEHHPDKLAARGLPEEFRESAVDKTQAIQKAYEQIKLSNK